jgi:AcrR family transcriptional regulator
MTVTGLAGAGTVRERLLAAADELFYAEGITAVGVEKIRATADVAKSSLYQHFKSKDQLVAAYLEGRSQGWRARLGAAVEAAGPDPRARLETVFAELGRWFEEPGFRGCPFINAAAEIPGKNHPALAVAARHREWLSGLFAGIAGQGAAADPGRLARQLLMLYNAAMVEAQAGSPTAAPDAGAAAGLLLKQAG